MARRKSADTETSNKNDGIIATDEELDMTRPIYLVNVSNTSKLFDDGKEKVRLSAPGTVGSIQRLRESVVNTPGFAYLRNAGKILLTYNSDMRNKATTTIEKAAKMEEDHLAKLKKDVLVEDPEVKDASDQLAALKAED
jgi:hypothetical protein